MYREVKEGEKHNILAKAILHYGQEHQGIVAMEECSELIKEVSKLIRTKADEYSNVDNLTEEIADVLIMIEQLKIIYRIPQEKIDVQTNYKLNRLKERIKMK